jgi:hypothetical protein
VKKTIIIPAIALFLVLAGIGMALVPPPPANQNIGFYDTNVSSLTATTCHSATPCHGSDDTAIANRHHLLVPTGEWLCVDCHPVDPGAPGGYGVVMERDCIQCHNGTAWSVNPAVDIPRPHHFTTNSTSRHCNDCHSYIANYDDIHTIPSYNTSLVTPLADYKLFNASSGRYWGGCLACHDADASSDPKILNNYDTHHQATSGIPGRQCTWCHVGNASSVRPDGSADVLRIYLTDLLGLGWDTVNLHMELRNSTILNLGDTINGTGCQKCHSVATIHNIQYDYTNTVGSLGSGHIGDNWDCNGCHAFWDAGEVEAPVGAIIPDMASVTPNKLTAGVATVVTITGSNFLSGSGTYTAAVSVDGTEITPDSADVTDSQIVVTLPALTAGIHTIKVVKNGDAETKYSSPGVLVAVTQADATSATLSGTQITIAGTGFGAQPDPAFNDLGIFVEHTTGKGKNKVTTTIKATIDTWTDTEIVATAGVSTGDKLTVKSLNGEDSTTISGGGGKPKK